MKITPPKCRTCSEPMKVFPSERRVYCSIKCRRKGMRATWLDRLCEECGTGFRIRKSVLKTNAAGRFCSRLCYWNALKKICGPLHRDYKPDKIDGRGDDWPEVRARLLAHIRCCIFCGTFEKICVHHLIPYRLTQDNSLNNLVPVCIGHHKKIEMITVRLIRDVKPDLGFLKLWLRASLWHLVVMARIHTMGHYGR